MQKLAVLALSVLALTACARNPVPMLTGDTGPTGGTDAGRTTCPDGRPIPPSGICPLILPDAGPGGTDTGPTGGDPCATAMATAASTVGCNGGFVSGEPAANGPNGACTGGGDAMPAGSCTTPNAVCAATMGIAAAGAAGECIVLCMPGPTYVSRGGCPTGYRCFELGMNDVCFRDCDATHACPATNPMCDAEGSCVGM